MGCNLRNEDLATGFNGAELSEDDGVAASVDEELSKVGARKTLGTFFSMEGLSTGAALQRGVEKVVGSSLLHEPLAAHASCCQPLPQAP